MDRWTARHITGRINEQNVFNPDQDGGSGQRQQACTPQQSQSFKRRDLDGWMARQTRVYNVVA